MIVEMDKVTVSAQALSEVLAALLGPAHHIRELQLFACAHPMVSVNNPIKKLVEEYNAAVDVYNAAAEVHNKENKDQG